MAMRTLEYNEALRVSGGNIFGDLKNIASNGLTHESKTLAIASLSTGLVIGSFLPFASLIGIGSFAAWAVYDMTGGNFSISFNSGNSETTEIT